MAPPSPAGADAEQQPQTRAHVAALVRVGDELSQTRLELGRGVGGRVFLGDAEPLPDDLGQRPERHPVPVGQAPAPVPPHLRGQPVGVLLELPAQPGLAHPGRTRDQHQPRHPPVRSGVEQLPDRTQLGIPPGQGGLQPVHPLRAADRGQHPGGPPQPGRLRLALQRMLAGIGEPDGAARQPLRGLIGQYLPRPGRGLDPRRGVHRIPGHHPLAGRAEVYCHRAGHHPGPGGQARHVLVLAELADRGDQVQGSADGPLRILLRGGRRPPHRHHRIPDELLRHAPVPPDDLPGDPDVPREQLTDRLRITRLGQRGEPHQVAEQHRAHPPLRHRLFRGGRGPPGGPCLLG